jgi:tetratricopeptide (TPR) repeat protein
MNDDFELIPNSEKAWRRRRTPKQCHQIGDALAACDHAIKLDPNPDTWCDKGELLEDCDKYEEAVAAYTEAINLDPRHYESWLNKVVCLFHLGRHEEAIAICDQLIEENTPILSGIGSDKVTLVQDVLVDTWTLKGRILYKLGRFNEALNAFEQIIKMGVVTSYIWYQKGIILFELGRKREAHNAIEYAIYNEPNLDWDDKGKILEDYGRNEAALAVYDSLIKQNHNSDIIYMRIYKKKSLLVQLKRYEEALAVYDELIKQNPNSDIVYEKGFFLAQLKRYNEALVAFTHAIQLDPSLYVSRRSIVVCLFHLGRHEEAIAICDQLIEENSIILPDSGSDNATSIQDVLVDTWTLKGRILYKLGRFNEALNAFEQIVEKNLETEYTLLQTGIILFELGRSNDAINVIIEALQSLDELATTSKIRNQELAEAWMKSGKILMDLEWNEEALSSFQIAIDLIPGFTEAWYNKCECLIKLQRPEEAFAAINRLDYIDPNYADTNDLRKRTRTMSKRERNSMVYTNKENRNGLFGSKDSNNPCHIIATHSKLVQDDPYHLDSEFSINYCCGNEKLENYKRIRRLRNNISIEEDDELIEEDDDDKKTSDSS